MSDLELEKVESLLEENAKLKAELDSFMADPYKKMYAGMLKQWNNIADDLNKLEISFDFSMQDVNEDDEEAMREAVRQAKKNKALYEQFMEVMENLKKMMENLEWLRKKTGLESDAVTKPQKARSPLEERAR